MPSAHTLEALEVARRFVADFHARHQRENGGASAGDAPAVALPVILDSGCGTGRSSALLAAAHPHLPVLGLDRSLARIAKNKQYARGTVGGGDAAKGEGADGNDDADDDEFAAASATAVAATPAATNLLLLRCDLVDFWRGAAADVAAERWRVPLHTILYPNPYPKAKNLGTRWHGHACWPDLLLLKADVLLLRASWKQYLDEFAGAVKSTSARFHAMLVVSSGPRYILRLVIRSRGRARVGSFIGALVPVVPTPPHTKPVNVTPSFFGLTWGCV
jgi:tRNA G46 methylase TrmB